MEPDDGAVLGNCCVGLVSLDEGAEENIVAFSDLRDEGAHDAGHGHQFQPDGR